MSSTQNTPIIQNTSTNIKQTKSSILKGIKDGNINFDYKYIIAIIILVLIAGIIYTNSKPYLVKKTLRQFAIIEKYNQIKSYDEDESAKLKDLKISSAFNSLNRYRCILDYQDTGILRGLLRLGCRYVELNIFPKDFKYGSTPMINSGFKKGQWKLMINSDIKLSHCISIIKDNAFTQLTNISGAPNYEDPLFIGLNLHTGHNTETLDKVASILIENLADRLLSPQYSYQYDNEFHDIEFNKLRNKVVIFSSPGFEGSKLEEIINASWVDDTQLNMRDTFINYFSNSNSNSNTEGFETNNENNESVETSNDIYDTLVNDILNKRRILRISAKTINDYGFNKEYLREFNKKGLTIVVPNEEGDILPVNYDPSVAWDLGCQFVCMNFQYLDKNIDKYVMEFRRQAIKPK